MKKRLLPILFASTLMMVGCGPKQNVPTVESLTITNKTELGAIWCVGDDDRAITVASSPVLEYEKEFKPAGHLRFEVEDSTIIEYAGVGNMIKAIKAGKTKVWATYYGVRYDSLEITVSSNRPEPQAKNATLSEIYSEATGKSSGLDTATQKYGSTLIVDEISYDAKGFMKVHDATRSTPVQLYESSKNMTFTWVTPGKYSYTNPKDFQQTPELMNLEPGDSITGEFIAFCYGGQVSGFELIGKITSVQKASRPTATSIAIKNKTEIAAYENESTQLEAEVGPTGASILVDWSVTNGTGKASINHLGLLVANKAGTVTVTAKARGVTGVQDSVEITIGANRDRGFVSEPVVGQSYKMSFIKNGAHYFYTGGIQSSYYGESSKDYSQAQDITFEDGGNGKYKISHTFDGAKKYLGVYDDGSHINFKWDLNADGTFVDGKATKTGGNVWSWNEEYHTLTMTLTQDKSSGALTRDYFFCTDTDNSSNSFRAIEVEGNLGGTRYVAVHFHSAEPEKEAAEEVTVAQALAIIAALADNGTTPKEYAVTGFVVKKYEWSTQYSNGDFVIADSASETDTSKQLTVMRVKDKTLFDSLVEGTTRVKVTGNLIKYVSSGKTTPETSANPTVTVIPAN